MERNNSSVLGKVYSFEGVSVVSGQEELCIMHEVRALTTVIRHLAHRRWQQHLSSLGGIEGSRRRLRHQRLTERGISKAVRPAGRPADDLTCGNVMALLSSQGKLWQATSSAPTDIRTDGRSDRPDGQAASHR